MLRGDIVATKIVVSTAHLQLLIGLLHGRQILPAVCGMHVWRVTCSLNSARILINKEKNK